MMYVYIKSDEGLFFLASLQQFVKTPSILLYIGVVKEGVEDHAPHFIPVH